MQYLDSEGLGILWNKIKGKFVADPGGNAATTGLLRRTGVNTWDIDTNTYLTGNQNISITGDATGSGSTSITLSIGNGKVTNAMLAGSIANGKLTNSKVTIAGTDVSLGGSITAATLRTQLELGSVWDKDSTTSVSTNTDATVPTSKAVKAYVDAAVAGASNYLGTIAAYTSLSTSAKKGDFYRVSTAWSAVSGKTPATHVGDIIIAEKNSPSALVDDTNWSLLHNELNTDTTYTIATGDSNGQIKVTPSVGSAYNVSVKGLAALAYKASLSATDIPSLSADKITSGTFSDDRIASATTWNTASSNATTLLGYFTNGIANNATSDADGNNIGDTYAKKSYAGVIIPLEDNGTTTAGDWKAKSDLVTSLENGKLYLYKITKAGAGTTYLTINSLAKTIIYRSGTTKLTTQYVVGEWLLLAYNSTSSSFKVVNDYDATDTYQVRQYVATDNAEYPLLHMYDTARASAGGYVVKYSKYTAGITINPSTNSLNTTGNLTAGGGVSANGFVDLNMTSTGSGAAVTQIRQWTEYDSTSDEQVLGANLGVELKNGKADKATGLAAGTAGTSSATSGSAVSIPYVTVNSHGIVTGYGTHTHTLGAAATKGVTDNTSASAVTSSDTNLITARTLYYAGYIKSVAYDDLTTKPTSSQIRSLVGDYVSTFGTKKGAITLRGGQTANGSVNLAMSNNELQASIVGLGSFAYKSSLAFSSLTSIPTTISGYGITDIDMEVTKVENVATAFELTVKDETITVGAIPESVILGLED